MAELVFAAGTSHSPALNSPAEDFARHAEVDRGEAHWRRTLLDKSGEIRTYDELLAAADPRLEAEIAPEVIAGRVAGCGAAIAHLGGAIAAADLDVLVVVGDDQHEQFTADNMPAIQIYWGETIQNGVLDLPADAPEWWRRARSQFHEDERPRDYPVDAELGLHLIGHLMDAEFDISQATRLGKERGEGHAFGFVHRRLIAEDILPIVPVALNTYFPPNQPRPRRCFDLGRAIARAIRNWGQDRRVGILASGGLSHFTIDEELDNLVLDACRDGDGDALVSIPLNKLNSGNSEIRNWITVAGAAEHLDMTWREYYPCYRSAAGTGCGMAFAVWG